MPLSNTRHGRRAFLSLLAATPQLLAQETSAHDAWYDFWNWEEKQDHYGKAIVIGDYFQLLKQKGMSSAEIERRSKNYLGPNSGGPVAANEFILGARRAGSGQFPVPPYGDSVPSRISKRRKARQSPRSRHGLRQELTLPGRPRLGCHGCRHFRQSHTPGSRAGPNRGGVLHDSGR